MRIIPLTVTAECAKNATCVYAGTDLLIKVTIANTGAETIWFPLPFLQKQGPFIKLKDAKSGEEMPLRPNLADPALRMQKVEMPPGAAVCFDWSITPHEMTRFGSEKIDLTAEVSISLGDTNEKTSEAIKYTGNTTLRITGKDVRR